MKKLFGQLKMSWLAVILFALAAGVYTGVIMLFPVLKETSFQDIGIAYEWWVIFAVIVAVNCDKAWEAALKEFVFFVISQPLIYLVEIAFGKITLEYAWGCYAGLWLPLTLATLPGGFIAYFAKHNSAWGGIVMGLGNSIELIMGAYYIVRFMRNMPYHLLSILVCLGSIPLMSLCVCRGKGNKIKAMVLPFIVLGVVFIILKQKGLVIG